MKGILATIVVALALTITTVASAMSTPQIEQKIGAQLNERFLFAGVNGHVQSVRCMTETSGQMWWCITKIYLNGYVYTRYYSATYNPNTGAWRANLT